MWTWVLCLLCCFLTGSLGVETTDPLAFDIKFDQDGYDCEAQLAHAVLSIIAMGAGSGGAKISLTSVMDISRSMNDTASTALNAPTHTKLELLQKTNDYVVQTLALESEVHKFGVVTFAKEVEEIVPLTTLEKDSVERIQAAINATQADGTTNLLGGILKGIEQQAADDDDAYVRALFVFTDGTPTEGEIRPEYILPEIQAAVDAAGGNIIVYIFGYGEDLNYNLLSDIAYTGNGVIYTIENQEVIPQAFGSALGGLIKEVALNLKVSITPKGKASISDVLHGGDETMVGDTVTLYLGDLFQREYRDVVVELLLSATCEATDSFEIVAEYLDAVTWADERIEYVAEAPNRNATVTPIPFTDVDVQVLVYEVAGQLEIAAEYLDQGNIPDCIRVLEQTQETLRKSGYFEEAYVQAISHDITTFQEQVEGTGYVTVDDVSTLDGMIKLLTTQRTGLVDTDSYETTGYTYKLASSKEEGVAEKQKQQEEVATMGKPTGQEGTGTGTWQGGYEGTGTGTRQGGYEGTGTGTRQGGYQVTGTEAWKSSYEGTGTQQGGYEGSGYFTSSPGQGTKEKGSYTQTTVTRTQIVETESSGTKTETGQAEVTGQISTATEGSGTKTGETGTGTKTIQAETTEQPGTSGEVTGAKIEAETIPGQNATTEVTEETPPFAIGTEIGVSSGQRSEQFIEFNITITLRPPDTNGSAPLSVSTILDTSGSMEGSKFDLMIDTQKRMIDYLAKDLEKTDVEMGIVLFSDHARTLLNLTKMKDIDISKLKGTLDTEEAGGQTALGEALQVGLQQQINQPRCYGSQTAFVMTDGQPTDKKGPDIVKITQDLLATAKYPIQIYAYGLGADADISLLESIAKVGDGKLFLIRSEDDIDTTFGEALGRLQSIAAKNLVVKVESATEAVEITSVFPPAGLFESTLAQWKTPDFLQGEELSYRISVQVPRDNIPDSLLDVSVSYTNVASCNLEESGTILVASQETATTDAQLRRDLEISIVLTLQTAVETCSTDLDGAITAVTQAIEMLEASDTPLTQYRDGLMNDLIDILTLLKDATKDASLIPLACDTLKAFSDVIETQQCTVTAGLPSLRVFETYCTDAVIKGGQALSGAPDRPSDAFNVSYRKAPSEISTVAQNISVPIEIQAIPPSDVRKPAFITFIVDASSTTTQEELDWMESVIVDVWQAYSQIGGDIFQNSTMSIIAFNAEYQTLLEFTYMAQLTPEGIGYIFDSIQIGGRGDYIGAVKSAFSMLEQYKGYHDMIVMSFITGGVDESKSVSQAAIFRDLAHELHYDLAFVPVFLRSDASTAYFDQYPSWVRLAILVRSDDTMAEIEAIFFSTAARRIIASISPSVDVKLLSVDGAIRTSTGKYMLPDLRYNENYTFTALVSVDERSGKQTVFTLSFTYFDLRSLYEWMIHSDAYEVDRIDAEILETLIDVRNQTSYLITEEILEAIDKEDYEEALDLTTYIIAVIRRIVIVPHKKITEVEEGCIKLLKLIFELIDGDVTREEVLSYIFTFIEDLDVIVQLIYPPEESIIEGPGPVIPVPVPQPTPQKLIVETEDKIPVADTDKTAVVNITFHAPPPDGSLVDAHATIILDKTTDSKSSHVDTTAQELLSSLGGRRGIRSVEIWGWNEGLGLIYRSDNFTLDDVDSAMRNVTDYERHGPPFYEVVLTEGIEKALSTNATISVMYWVITSRVSEQEDIDALLDIAHKSLEEGQSPLTIFTFHSGIDAATEEFLAEISDLSGGKDYALELDYKTAPEVEQAHRIAEVSREAVGWIDVTFCKDVVIRLSPLGGGSIRGVYVVEGIGTIVPGPEIKIRIHSLAYGSYIHIEVTMVLGKESTHDIVDAVQYKGDYYALRTQEEEAIQEGTASVERFDEKTFNRIQLIESLLADSAEKLLLELGGNLIYEALVTVEQSQVLIEYSGLQDVKDFKRQLDGYVSIEGNLETYAESRDNGTAIQTAGDEIAYLKTNVPYPSDHGDFLITEANPEPLSAIDEESTVSPSINISTSLPEKKSKSTGKKSVTMTVVFDSAEYQMLIDREVPNLDAQIRLATELVENLLINEGYKIHLTVIGNTHDNTIILTPIDLDKSSAEEVKPYMENINMTGSPADLKSSLEVGFTDLEDVTETDERIMLLFSAASSICVVEDPEIEAVVLPYTSYPVNPVKVLTYIVGPSEPARSDPISDLTGGVRYYIERLIQVYDAVDGSLANLKDKTIRALRLRILPSEWNTNPIELASEGTVLADNSIWTATVKDLSLGESVTIDLNHNLSAWEGNADLFEYGFSYFRMDTMRWYLTPYTPVRVLRAPEVVIEERDAQLHVTEQAALEGFDLANAGKLEEAAEVIWGAMDSIASSPYQDDAYLIELSDYLNNVYDLILEALNRNVSNEIMSEEISESIFSHFPFSDLRLKKNSKKVSSNPLMNFVSSTLNALSSLF